MFSMYIGVMRRCIFLLLVSTSIAVAIAVATAIIIIIAALSHFLTLFLVGYVICMFCKLVCKSKIATGNNYSAATSQPKYRVIIRIGMHANIANTVHTFTNHTQPKRKGEIENGNGMMF